MNNQKQKDKSNPFSIIFGFIFFLILFGAGFIDNLIMLSTMTTEAFLVILVIVSPMIYLAIRYH